MTESTEEKAIAKALVESGVPEDKVRELAKVLTKLNTKYPKLTDEEITRIAESVSQKFVEQWGGTLQSGDRRRFGEKLASIAKQVAVGLVSSGVFALLVYLFTHTISLAAPVDDREILRRFHEGAERVDRVLADEPETRKKLEEETPRLFTFPQRFMLGFESQVSQDPTVREFADVIKGKYSNDPERMLYNSFTKSVYASLIGLAKEKLVS